MSPYPAQLDYDTLIEKAWFMIEKEGVENLSLSKLAAAFGVKAPSLYKHIKNKADLLRAVNVLTNHRLSHALTEAANSAGNDPAARMMALMRAYRDFAHQNPHTYTLAFLDSAPELRLRPEAGVEMALPLQTEMTLLSGEGYALTALRGAWALVHGFVMLELGSHFQRGGDLDDAFDQVLRAYLSGWANLDAP